MLIGVGLRSLRDLDRDEDYLTLLFGDGAKTIGKGRTLLLKAGLRGEVEQTNTASNFRLKAPGPAEIAAMQREVFDPMTAFLAEGGVFVSDGRLDQIFTADRTDGLLVMNYSGADVTRPLTLPDGSVIQREIRDLTINEYPF